MRLILERPEIAGRPCQECVKWDWNPDGSKVTRAGVAWPKHPLTMLPCGSCPKQPADVPDALRKPSTADEMSERNQRAYRHYRECRATLRFPDDPLVRFHASLIRAIEDEYEQAPMRDFLTRFKMTR